MIENLVQYATSGVAQFMQRAAVAALEHGEEFVAHQIARARRGPRYRVRRARRDRSLPVRGTNGRVLPVLHRRRRADTRRLALRLIDEANVGLAPGTAFGEGGADFLRVCFLRDPGQLETAAERLVTALSKADDRRGFT